jgi:hypothetical protein
MPFKLYIIAQPIRINSIKMTSDDDVFMNSKPDPRLVTRLATDSWFDVVSYLPVRDIVPALPLTCRYFNNEVVWGKWSGRLMWLEMAPGAIDAHVFKRWPGENPPSMNALIRACWKRAPSNHVSALITGGANVDAVDRHGNTALHLACWRWHDCHGGIVRALLRANVDPNITGEFGWTPLMLACAEGNSVAVSALIESGANINHTDPFGLTALMHACVMARVDCVRVMVNARADVAMRNHNGLIALNFAHSNGNRDVIRLIEESSQFN